MFEPFWSGGSAFQHPRSAARRKWLSAQSSLFAHPHGAGQLAGQRLILLSTKFDRDLRLRREASTSTSSAPSTPSIDPAGVHASLHMLISPVSLLPKLTANPTNTQMPDQMHQSTLQANSRPTATSSISNHLGAQPFRVRKLHDCILLHIGCDEPSLTHDTIQFELVGRTGHNGSGTVRVAFGTVRSLSTWILSLQTMATLACVRT